jgi:2-methylcitrate dehydratase PrpD
MADKNTDSSIAVTDRLTQFIAASRWDDIPQTVRHEAKRSLLNFFAVSLSACHDPTIETAARTYRR